MKHRVYLQRSHKFITTSEHLKSFEVDSNRHAAVESSWVESDVLKSTAVDLGMGVGAGGAEGAAAPQLLAWESRP